MPRRYFNWKLAIVLFLGLVVLGVSAFGLRRLQRTGRAEKGLELGNKAYDEHRWEEAAENLGRYLAVEQDNVQVLLKYADAQLKIRPIRRNNIQQAIGAYRTVLRVDEGNSEAAMQLTEVYLTVGMPGEAELIAKRHLEKNKNPELHRVLALALSGQRKFNEAAEELKAICAEHPDQILAYEALGQLIEQRPNDFLDTPAYWFNQAVEVNPSSALAYIIRASFYLRKRDVNEALADLQRAEKCDLSDPTVRLRLAQGLINANLLDRAEEHLAVVHQAIPKNQGLWQTWARLALRSQSREKMLEIAETGLEELSSEPWDFMLVATELFIQGGKLERANKCISELQQKDIAPAITLFLRGLVAVEDGHLFESVEYWQQSIELGNKSPQVRLALASVLSRLGDTQSALRHLRQLVSERPNLLDGHIALAKLFTQTGNWSQTVEHAAVAMELSPGNPEAALLHLHARFQLLVTSPTPANAQLLQDIEERLSALLETTDTAGEVVLLQFRLALQKRAFTEAEELVTQLKKVRFVPVQIAMAEAELLYAQDKISEAALMLNGIIETFPQDIEPVRGLAVLLDRQGNHEKCEEIIKEALARIERPTAQRELALILAQFYARWNQEDKSYPLLKELMQKLPNDIPIKRRLLQCEQVLKDSEQGQKLVDDIKSLEGEDGWQWRYEQAKVWFTTEGFKERYPQIVSLLQKNLLLNPNDQTSRMLLARSYERAGELQLAISTYREALGRSPNDLRVLVPTVAALYSAKEYDDAEEILNRAAEQKLYHPQLQELQFQTYIRQGQLDSASDILQDLLGNDPNNQATCLSLALLKMQQNDFDEAGELLAKLKIHDPNSLVVTNAQIQLSIRQNNSEEALRLCGEIVNNLGSASAYILRARTYATLGQTKKAIKDLERATAIEPNNAEVWVARSDFYNSMGQIDMAIADIQQALSLVPSNVQIQKRAISLLLTSKEPSRIRKGKALLHESLGSNPEDVDLQLLKAGFLLAEGTAPAIENATRILEKITEERPDNTKAWMLLGESALKQGESGKAYDITLRGLAHNPNDKTLLMLKARAEAARSPVLAISTLRGLYELNPKDDSAAILLANTYINAGEPGKAESLMRNQLTICSASARRSCQIALAVALYKNGNEAEAQKEFDSLQESEPDDPVPLLAQVRLLKDDGLWSLLRQKVIDWYQKHPEDSRTPIAVSRELIAIEDSQAKKIVEDILRLVRGREPDNTEAMSMLAMMLEMDGRSAEAAELYQQLLKLEPNNLVAINNLAWIMCEKQGKYQEALELAQKGLNLAPQYMDLIDTRGMVYYRLGEFSKAVQDFTSCIKLYPNSAPAGVASRFHLARAFAKLGQKDQAINYLKQALDFQSRIGGLSTTELAEAQLLLEQLQEGN